MGFDMLQLVKHANGVRFEHVYTEGIMNGLFFSKPCVTGNRLKCRMWYLNYVSLGPILGLRPQAMEDGITL